MGLKKIVKTPLRDITNVHQVVDLKLVAGWWENFSAKSKELNGWQATLSAEVFVLCQTTLVCHNNFLVCKVITLKSNLSYQVKVGDHNCYVEGAHKINKGDPNLFHKSHKDAQSLEYHSWLH